MMNNPGKKLSSFCVNQLITSDPNPSQAAKNSQTEGDTNRTQQEDNDIIMCDVIIEHLLECLVN